MAVSSVSNARGETLASFEQIVVLPSSHTERVYLLKAGSGRKPVYSPSIGSCFGRRLFW